MASLTSTSQKLSIVWVLDSKLAVCVLRNNMLSPANSNSERRFHAFLGLEMDSKIYCYVSICFE